jgi:phosphoesterase RecJ-like protein
MLKKIISEQTVEQFRQLFVNAENIVLTAHVNPDGDAIGSTLGLSSFLRNMGKNVNVVLPNGFPDYLAWIKDVGNIVLFNENQKLAESLVDNADLICCLDFNELKRIERLGEIIARSGAKKALIDHHLNPVIDVMASISMPEASSTCELVYRLIDALGMVDLLDVNGATALYSGMNTDTGGFTYNSSDPEVFIIVGELMERGVDKDRVNRFIYNNANLSRLRLMGYVLYKKLEVFAEYNASLFTLTRDEMKELGYVKGDLEGVVNMPLTLKGHKLSISLRDSEDVEGEISVSIRSYDDLPANDMAKKYFNGGGHKNAAGGKLWCSMEKAREIAIEAIKDFC